METLGKRQNPTLPRMAVWAGSIEIAGEEGKIELSPENWGLLAPGVPAFGLISQGLGCLSAGRSG